MAHRSWEAETITDSLFAASCHKGRSWTTRKIRRRIWSRVCIEGPVHKTFFPLEVILTQRTLDDYTMPDTIWCRSCHRQNLDNDPILQAFRDEEEYANCNLLNRGDCLGLGFQYCHRVIAPLPARCIQLESDNTRWKMRRSKRRLRCCWRAEHGNRLNGHVATSSIHLETTTTNWSKGWFARDLFAWTLVSDSSLLPWRILSQIQILDKSDLPQ